MFAPDHEGTMGWAEALGIGLLWAAADMFRRSLGLRQRHGLLAQGGAKHVRP